MYTENVELTCFPVQHLGDAASPQITLVGFLVLFYMCGRLKRRRFLGVNTRASILQDYWGDIKEDWVSGGPKSPAGSKCVAPVWSLGDEVPQKLKFFL